MLDYGRLDVPGGSEVKDASISWPSRNQKKSEKIMHEKWFGSDVISARGERFIVLPTALFGLACRLNFERFHLQKSAAVSFRHGFHGSWKSYRVVDRAAQRNISTSRPHGITTTTIITGPTYHGRWESVAVRRHSTMVGDVVVVLCWSVVIWCVACGLELLSVLFWVTGIVWLKVVALLRVQ